MPATVRHNTNNLKTLWARITNPRYRVWKYGVRKIDGSVIDLNAKCGIKESDFKEVTRLIKGATTEFEERKEAFFALIKILNYENCVNKK